MANWEYKTIDIETGSWISSGEIEPAKIDREMNHWGDQGFELVSVIPVSTGSVGTKKIVLFFKRRKA